MVGSCVICLEAEAETEALIQLTCCRKHIHQLCLDLWLNQSTSQGRCPHCRHQLRDRGHSSSLDNWNPVTMDEEIDHIWNNPRGYINITTGTGASTGIGAGYCDIQTQSQSQSAMLAPIIHKCPYYTMENSVPNDFITAGHIIVLVDENGNYFDIVNIPVGWILCVNNIKRAVQLTEFLRLDPAPGP